MFLKLSPNIVRKLSPNMSNIVIYHLAGTELKSTSIIFENNCFIESLTLSLMAMWK